MPCACAGTSMEADWFPSRLPTRHRRATYRRTTKLRAEGNYSWPATILLPARLVALRTKAKEGSIMRRNLANILALSLFSLVTLIAPLRPARAAHGGAD